LCCLLNKLKNCTLQDKIGLLLSSFIFIKSFEDFIGFAYFKEKRIELIKFFFAKKLFLCQFCFVSYQIFCFFQSNKLNNIFKSSIFKSERSVRILLYFHDYFFIDRLQTKLEKTVLMQIWNTSRSFLNRCEDKEGFCLSKR
jgi:hypothetical protein